MYKNKSVVLTICARSGSKGIKGKNIRSLLGKPLIAYTIEQAQQLPFVDRIVLSTDGQDIRKVAESWGLEVPFLRPKSLATDKASKIPAIIHAVKKAEGIWRTSFDVIIDLDPTSPLRTTDDVYLTLKILVDTPSTDAVFSVCEARRNPYFNMVEVNSLGYASLSKKSQKTIKRRQDAPEVFEMNASIYAIWKNILFTKKTFFTERTRIHIMDRGSIDIDSQIDFEFVEFMMRKRKGLV